MENLSRISSSCKEKPQINPKLMSSYTSHTRCQSVSKPSNKQPKKLQKLHTQMISSRKYNSTYKGVQNDFLTKQPTSPYRTSFSSTKGRRKKNSCNDNIKCQSSYNLKDCSISKQMMNSSELFNSLYVEPMEMIYVIQKDNKQSMRSTQNRKKNPSSSLKNQVTTKRLHVQNQHPISNYWQKSQQNLKTIFKRSKSKQVATNNNDKKSKNSNYQKQSIILSPTQNGSKIFLNHQQGLTSPYSDVLSRTFDILNKYEKKMKKLYEDKVTFQRLYQKSKTECEHLRKSLKKKQKKYTQSQMNTHTKQKDIRTTKDTLKISLQTFKR